jgi:hypothetical protein
MKNGTTTSSRNAAISPYSSDIARILLGNIHGRADAPHPALAGCAHAVSGHVAAVHIGSFLRRGNPDPRMSLVGQSLPRRSNPHDHACPLRSESDRHKSKCDAPLRANRVLTRCSRMHHYSITSSAATSSLSGTVTPSIRAVSALMTSSNLLACTTGKSEGFAPLRMRPV